MNFTFQLILPYQVEDLIETFEEICESQIEYEHQLFRTKKTWSNMRKFDYVFKASDVRAFVKLGSLIQIFATHIETIKNDVL
jgi:hypothetical protein